jgi:hypothetical protein
MLKVHVIDLNNTYRVSQEERKRAGYDDRLAHKPETDAMAAMRHA